MPRRSQLIGTEPGRLGRILERVVREGIVFLGPGGEIEYLNEPARRLLSEDPAELERLATEILAGIEASGAEPPHRVQVETADGPRALYVEPGMVDEEECVGRILVLKDAKAVEALEEDLFLANRMRGLGEIYLAMAHDLKTPVNAMTLMLDNLRQSLAGKAETAGEEAARRLEDVDVLRSELTRFHRSIQAFLSQASPASAARRRFDLRRLLREVARVATPLAKNRDVRLRLALGSTPSPVDGYRDRLRQAFQNVVLNAVEASPPKGEVKISLRADRTSLVTAVLDEGPGIAPEIAKRIFRMHFTTKESGSGIGLFVARAAVLAHGGAIRVENRPEGGAAVEIRLPAGVSEGALA